MGLTVFEDGVRRWQGSGPRQIARFRSRMDKDPSGFFAELKQRWYAPSPKVAQSFSRHAEALVGLMKQLRENKLLSFFDKQISPEWDRLMKGAKEPPTPTDLGLPPTYEQRRAGFHFCNSLIQLMEEVYLDLDLEHEAEHPDNAGWINLFKHWSWSSMFRVSWVVGASCYGARFRNFCRDRLGLDHASLWDLVVTRTESWTNKRLNFREIELLSPRVFDTGVYDLYLLEIWINRPEPRSAFSGPRTMAEFTVGVAVVDKRNKRLAYFRIQDHLRRMGLARIMLAEMKDRGLVLGTPQWAKGLSRLAEPVTSEAKESVERILASVPRRRREPPSGAATPH